MVGWLDKFNMKSMTVTLDVMVLVSNEALASKREEISAVDNWHKKGRNANE